MIIGVAFVAVLIGAMMRVRWEDQVAFIGGPAGLLIMITLANSAFEPKEDKSATVQVVEAADSTASPLIAWILFIWLVLICGWVLFTFLAKRPSPAGPATLGGLFSFFRGGPGRRSGRKAGTGANSALYFATAVKLGAMTAAADGRADQRELEALKSVFSLTDVTCPEADALYQAQLQHPDTLGAIIKPFVSAYGHRSAIADTLIFGMTCVALADGVMTPAELGIIRMAGEMLGLSLADTNRILMSAGYFGQKGRTHNRSQQNRSGNGRSSTGYGSGLSEREQHLQTLGLQMGADKTTIRKAWRDLARKYHPDKLVSQNLPAEEMEKAEQMMQAINEAYDWLKEYGET